MRREEVVVIGGGMAGVAAALAARKSGAQVTLIDEQDAIGGYMRWTLSTQTGLPAGLDGKRGFELAKLGWDALYDADVNVQLSSVVWGLFEDNVLGVVNPESSYRLGADRIIVATGSTDIGIPFAGWELAGVMTARAAIIAMNLHRVLPGRRAGVVGNGSDAVEVMDALTLCGAEVVLHVANPAQAVAGGDGVVSTLSDGQQTAEVDVVITAHGVQPDAELLLQANGATVYDESSGVPVPKRDEALMSTLDGIYVVGDAAGICTAAVAAAEGEVAGLAATGARGLDDAQDVLDRARKAGADG